MEYQMEKIYRVLAIDYGASSGRAILGIYDGKRIELMEVHRFPNEPVIVGDTIYWDVLRLFHELKQGLKQASLAGGFESVAVDTWGVDFGLLDEKGYLLENPIHYRDCRTKGMLEKAFFLMSKNEFYQITGNQFMEINTAFQLLSLVQNRPELMQRVNTILLMPDLFHYFLTGIKKAEYTIATTTQLMDVHKGSWSDKVIKELGIRKEIFPEIIPSGTCLGELSDSICSELAIKKAKVTAAAGHDTQNAIAAVPSMEKEFAFISCGTWSLLGTELDKPLVNSLSERYNITNEGGCGGKNSFLSNIIGLWLIQESRRQWRREGMEYSFGELEQLAEKAEPFQSFINPDAPEFAAPGDLPARIISFCKRSGQKIPASPGEIVRCINESLAFKYRYALERLEECTGKQYPVIYMVGGGTQSSQLCSFTAGASGRRVSAGPVEATALGNIVLQLISMGALRDLREARSIIADLPEIKIYEPDGKDWNGAYEKFLKVLSFNS